MLKFLHKSHFGVQNIMESSQSHLCMPLITRLKNIWLLTDIDFTNSVSKKIT